MTATLTTTPATKPTKPDAQAVQAQLREMVGEVYGKTGEDGQTAIDRLAMALEPVIAGVLPANKSPARVRTGRLLARIALGSTWGEALKAENAQWAEMACLTIHSGLFALSEACKAVGYETIKAVRLSAAHSRAVDGWLEPVFGKDGQVGEVRRYSDRLLELLIKGDDPQRYNPQQAASGAGSGQAGPIAIQINIGQLPGANPPQSITVSAPDAPA